MLDLTCIATVLWCLLTLNMQQMQYRIAGKFGGGKVSEFGESSVFRQTKTIQLSTCN